MSRSPLRRFLTGLFALWFVALGLTRGTYMACLDHRAEHLAAAAAAARAVAAPASVHAGHAAHDTHAGHHMAAPTGEASLSSSDASPPQAPEHCTCAGDCCCAVPAQAPPRATIACAPDARVPAPLPEFAQTARPTDVVPYLLPFATAPPALTTLS